MTQFTTQSIELLYDESKFWITFGSVLWTAFKVITWFKTIKTNDLHHIQLGIDSIHGELKETSGQLQVELKEQTKAIVDELKEMRADMRSYNAALITPIDRR